MARKSRSLASTLNNWKQTAGGFDKHSAELAFSADEAAKLKAIIAETETLNIKQEQLKADLAKTTEALNSNLDSGEKLHASIIRYASGKFGPKSKEMMDFKATGEM